jgi:selenide,water dikinase
MSPAELDQALAHVKPLLDPKLLVGYDKADDAAVYQISDDLAVVHTLDFFTPIVDDPYTFGRIAAANSLSDIYAMGAKPLLALNIVCFPKTLSMDILGDILRGGADVAREAGIPVAGGHTVDCPEPKYGLAVTGIVHPDHVITNSSAQPGDALILTKPIGSGVITTAMRAGKLTPEQGQPMVDIMMELNYRAAEVMKQFPVHACTDITGYGLLGHASEMAFASGYGWEISAKKIPLVEPALEMAAQGAIPGGSQSNLLHFSKGMDISLDITQELLALLFDAQTSGGLLISVDGNESDHMLSALHDSGVIYATNIGTIRPDKKRILLK